MPLDAGTYDPLDPTELDSHGYSVVDITPERVQCDWWYLSMREDPDATQTPGPSWLTRVGTNHVERFGAPVLGPVATATAPLAVPTLGVSLVAGPPVLAGAVLGAALAVRHRSVAAPVEEEGG